MDRPKINRTSKRLARGQLLISRFQTTESSGSSWATVGRRRTSTTRWRMRRGRRGQTTPKGRRTGAQEGEEKKEKKDDVAHTAVAYIIVAYKIVAYMRRT